MQNDLITYKNASKIAYDALKETVFTGIGAAYDMGDCYMFIADNPDKIFYTCRTILVSKTDGSVKWYNFTDYLRDEEKEKKELTVIDEYSYKGEKEEA